MGGALKINTTMINFICLVVTVVALYNELIYTTSEENELNTQNSRNSISGVLQHQLQDQVQGVKLNLSRLRYIFNSKPKPRTQTKNLTEAELLSQLQEVHMRIERGFPVESLDTRKNDPNSYTNLMARKELLEGLITKKQLKRLQNQLDRAQRMLLFNSKLKCDSGDDFKQAQNEKYETETLEARQALLQLGIGTLFDEGKKKWSYYRADSQLDPNSSLEQQDRGNRTPRSRAYSESSSSSSTSASNSTSTSSRPPSSRSGSSSLFSSLRSSWSSSGSKLGSTLQTSSCKETSTHQQQQQQQQQHNTKRQGQTQYSNDNK